PELIRSLKSFTQTSVAPFQSLVSADPGILSPSCATSLVSLRLFLSRKSLTLFKPYTTSFSKYRISLESQSKDGDQTMLENFAARSSQTSLPHMGSSWKTPLHTHLRH